MKEKKFSESIQIAQSNGWLAAKQLSFPLCSKLVPIGQNALLEQYKATITNTSTVITNYKACPNQN